MKQPINGLAGPAAPQGPRPAQETLRAAAGAAAFARVGRRPEARRVALPDPLERVMYAVEVPAFGYLLEGEGVEFVEALAATQHMGAAGELLAERLWAASLLRHRGRVVAPAAGELPEGWRAGADLEELAEALPRVAQAHVWVLRRLAARENAKNTELLGLVMHQYGDHPEVGEALAQGQRATRERQRLAGQGEAQAGQPEGEREREREGGGGGPGNA